MTNTTADEGYLAPTGTTYGADDALIDLVAAICAAITGLDRNSVRPRFQLGAAPNMPGPTVNWMAIGVTMIREGNLRGMTEHKGDGDGRDEVRTPEFLDCLASFYGPASQTFARLLRDGLKVSQNRDELWRAGLAFADCGPIITLGETINSSWYRRSDMTVGVSGVVLRNYPVLNLLSAQGVFVTVRSVEGAAAVVDQQNWQTPQPE